jgi:hypothetical protein
MSPTNPLPTTGFSPEVIDDLATAFKDVWTMLYAQVPPDNEEAVRLSGNLSRTLVTLASEGITDPKELRRKALGNMILTDHYDGDEPLS